MEVEETPMPPEDAAYIAEYTRYFVSLTGRNRQLERIRLMVMKECGRDKDIPDILIAIHKDLKVQTEILQRMINYL